jgi:hypothetical protein
MKMQKKLKFYQDILLACFGDDMQKSIANHLDDDIAAFMSETINADDINNIKLKIEKQEQETQTCEIREGNEMDSGNEILDKCNEIWTFLQVLNKSFEANEVRPYDCTSKKHVINIL